MSSGGLLFGLQNLYFHFYQGKQVYCHDKVKEISILIIVKLK